jgi:hypothetical protein
VKASTKLMSFCISCSLHFPAIYTIFHQSPEKCKHGVPLYVPNVKISIPSTVIPQNTSNRFMSFRLYEMHILMPVFQFLSQFSLIRAPLSHKPIVVPGTSSRKLIFVLRVLALRAVLEERIKLINRGITVLLIYTQSTL